MLKSILSNLIFFLTLFGIGLIGIASNRVKILTILICVEVVLFVIGVKFVIFSIYVDPTSSQVFTTAKLVLLEDIKFFGTNFSICTSFIILFCFSRAMQIANWRWSTKLRWLKSFKACIHMLLLRHLYGPIHKRFCLFLHYHVKHKKKKKSYIPVFAKSRL